MDETAKMLALYMGPVYLMLGLSILLYAKAWKKLMDKWEKDHLLLFPLMFVMTILGLIVIHTYNVWAWNVGLLVTIIGWALFAKGVLYFLLPGSILKPLMKLGQNTGLLYLGGIAAVVIGVVLSYYAYYDVAIAVV